MKTLLSCFLFSAVLVPPLFAQESAAVPLPAQSPSEKSDLNEPMSLMPQTPSSIERRPPATERQPSTAGSETSAPLPQQGPELKQSKTIATEEDLKERIRFREVKTQALKDANVRGQWERAQAATTDPEKREVLRQYYTQLYSRMLKIDSSLAKRIEQQKKLSLGRLDQSRVSRGASAQNSPAVGEAPGALSEEQSD